MAVVLIVEDDLTVSDTLYELLEGEHRCHIAKTAEEALTYIESEGYDLVLTDVSMPGASGLELLGRIRQSQPDTPVIIISGIDYRRHTDDLRSLGAFDSLVKPFRLEEVEGCVARALEQRAVLLRERRDVEAGASILS